MTHAPQLPRTNQTKGALATGVPRAAKIAAPRGEAPFFNYYEVAKSASAGLACRNWEGRGEKQEPGTCLHQRLTRLRKRLFVIKYNHVLLKITCTSLSQTSPIMTYF